MRGYGTVSVRAAYRHAVGVLISALPLGGCVPASPHLFLQVLITDTFLSTDLCLFAHICACPR